MLKTYQGSCHCGRIKFEVDADIDHVRVCDCSICRRRGALIYRVPLDCLRLLVPLEEMSLTSGIRRQRKTTSVQPTAYFHFGNREPEKTFGESMSAVLTV